MLSEAEFHRLWGSEEQIYLVTDTFGEEGGALDHHSPFVVVGHVGDQWVLSNQASSHSSNAKPCPGGQSCTGRCQLIVCQHERLAGQSTPVSVGHP